MKTDRELLELRNSIIAEMKRQERQCRKDFKDTNYSRRFYAAYCTWWFPKRAGIPTDMARKELNRMERDGIVTSDRSQRNNIKWMLTESTEEIREPRP